MKHYHHLTEVERYQIEAHLRAGMSFAGIAIHMDRPRSCISREVDRNGGSANYRAQHAQARYREQLRSKGKLRQRWHAAFHEVAVPLLREGWSPEQISGVFRGSECAVSHEWLYQRILQDKQSGGRVYRHLRCQKQRKKRYGSPERRGQIINRRGISERPAEVESRQQLGHWEGDTMIGAGHRGALVTLVERASGLVKIQRVVNKEAKGVTRAIHRMLRPHRSKVHLQPRGWAAANLNASAADKPAGMGSSWAGTGAVGLWRREGAAWFSCSAASRNTLTGILKKWQSQWHVRLQKLD